MPSPQFIKSYFSSFTDDIISQPLQKGEKKDEDKDKEGEAAEITERSEYFLHFNIQTTLDSKNETTMLVKSLRNLYFITKLTLSSKYWFRFQYIMNT